MSAHTEGSADFRHAGYPEASPLEFTTAFRAGTGGHRIAIFSDRIVTYRRDGRVSVLPLDDVASVSTFEDGPSQPTYGAHFVLKSPSREAAYRFDAAATRRAFLRAARLLPQGEE